MAFVEDGLMRRVIEGAFDFLKFGEVASCNIAQHHLRAKPAGVAILDETGLPFHDLPIPGASPTPLLSNIIRNRVNRPFTPNSDEPFIPGRSPARHRPVSSLTDFML